jgi:hypothetical protein
MAGPSIFAVPSSESPARNPFLFLFDKNRPAIGHLTGGLSNGHALLIIRREYNSVNRQS